MIKIAVYGSLKRGKYNHPIIQDGVYCGETRLPGTLYSVSSYPALLDEGEGDCVAEIYEVSEVAHLRVRDMELGAGYVEKEVEGCVVYYAGEELADYCRKHKEIISTY